MSLFRSLFGGRKPEPFDPNPREIQHMPARPYRILHAGLPFFSDPECLTEVQGARLVVLLCEDPSQKHRPIECMPVRKKYLKQQFVRWDINNKKMWDVAWYRNPETGKNEKAWSQAVEFTGPVVKLPSQ